MNVFPLKDLPCVKCSSPPLRERSESRRAVLWKDYRSGVLAEKDLETAAFNAFLYGRMIGAAAEIDDHLNRGRNMDTRTPQEQCAFVV